MWEGGVHGEEYLEWAEDEWELDAEVVELPFTLIPVSRRCYRKLVLPRTAYMYRGVPRYGYIH